MCVSWPDRMISIRSIFLPERDRRGGVRRGEERRNRIVVRNGKARYADPASICRAHSAMHVIGLHGTCILPLALSRGHFSHVLVPELQILRAVKSREFGSGSGMFLLRCFCEEGGLRKEKQSFDFGQLMFLEGGLEEKWCRSSGLGYNGRRLRSLHTLLKSRR